MAHGVLIVVVTLKKENNLSSYAEKTPNNRRIMSVNYGNMDTIRLLYK